MTTSTHYMIAAIIVTVLFAFYSTNGGGDELAKLRKEHNVLRAQVSMLTKKTSKEVTINIPVDSNTPIPTTGGNSNDDNNNNNNVDIKNSILETLDGVQLRANFLDPKMADVIRSRADQNDIVFLSADYSYREVLWNWIVIAESKNISNWIISCYDVELKTWLEQRGTTCHFVIPSEYISRAVDQNEILTNRHCKGQEGYHMQAKSMQECIKEGCPRFYNTDCLGVSYTAATKTCYKCVGDPRTDFVSGIPQDGTDLALFTGRHRIWHLRWMAAMDVFALGINIVFVDLDAIVVQNFFPLIRSLNTDVVAQRDFGPNKAVGVWGNSICMGFSYWKTGTRLRHEMIKNINTILEKSGDDQSAVANALMIEGVRFPEKLTPLDRSPKKASSARGYTLAMLPLHSFARKCKGRIAPPHMIAHCVFGGKPAHKKHAINKLHGWKLRSDYETISYGNYSSFKEYSADLLS